MDKIRLKDEIHQAFKKMQDAKPPENASKAELEKHFAQLLLDLAKDLANGFENYVKSGDVVGVETNASASLSGNPETVTIHGTQSNSGKIQ